MESDFAAEATMNSQDPHPARETPIIRRLHPRHVQDAKALIREVWREHFQSHEEALVREYLLLPNALDDIDKAADGADPNCLFPVQEVRARVVATGAIHRVSEDVCELSRMFVASAWRRRGLAMTLARHLLDFARERHFKTVRLASNKQLVTSHQLYRALGFRACQSFDPDDDGHSINMQFSLEQASSG
jgi:GNAT superfamily N-acetyltransferase